MTLRKRVAGIGAATAFVLLLAVSGAVGVAGAEVPMAAEVLVEDFVFQPDAVTVRVGGTVAWTLGADPDQHTVTPRDPEQFEDSGQLFEGDTYEVTFDEAGTVHYFCRLHPTMTGTVSVVAAPSATVMEAATPSPSATPTAARVSASPSAPPAASPVAAREPTGEPAALLLPLAIAAAFAVAIVVALDWLRRHRTG